jgi:hypothetical protein
MSAQVRAPTLFAPGGAAADKFAKATCDSVRERDADPDTAPGIWGRASDASKK